MIYRTVYQNPFIPHDPTDKQIEALKNPAKELFFGGSAGGGKSDFLLMAALQYVEIPHYSAIIFRRTFQDLQKPGACTRHRVFYCPAIDAIFSHGLEGIIDDFTFHLR